MSPIAAPPAADEVRPPGRTRLVAVDLARAVAIAGMILAHLVPTRFPPADAPTWAVLPAVLFHGRSAVLFVVVAGFSLALAARSSALRAARWAALSRTPVLWLAGMLLLADDPSPVYVIVHFYAGFFVVGAIALGWSARCRLAVSAHLLVGVPLVLLAWPDLAFRAARIDAGLPSSAPHPSTVLLTGAYPMLPWAGYFLLGMVLADGGLRRRPRRAALVATAVAAGTHLTSLLSGLTLTDRGALASIGIGSRPAGEVDLTGYDVQARLLSHMPTWAGQLAATGHTTSVVAYVSCLAFAVAVIAACFGLQSWVAARLGAGAKTGTGTATATGAAGALALSHLMTPVAALGRCALSVYVLHVLLLGRRWLPTDPPRALLAALAVIAVSAGLSWLWLLRWRAGPLELLATLGARATRRAVLPRAMR